MSISFGERARGYLSFAPALARQRIKLNGRVAGAFGIHYDNHAQRRNVICKYQGPGNIIGIVPSQRLAALYR